MAKILLTITALLILAFIVVAMYCACVLAGRSDENENNSDNNEGADDVFLKKQICPRCKTGKYTYDLDPKSETCPYIGCWRRNKCSFYKPLEKPSKTGIFRRNKNKVTVTPPEKLTLCAAKLSPLQRFEVAKGISLSSSKILK